MNQQYINAKGADFDWLYLAEYERFESTLSKLEISNSNG